MLNSLIYLLQNALIGKKILGENELYDCGDPDRAQALQDQGVAFVVGDALEWKAWLHKLNKNGEHCVEVEQFLNRIRSFPLEMRCPEWEELMQELGPLQAAKPDTKPKRKKPKKEVAE